LLIWLEVERKISYNTNDFTMATQQSSKKQMFHADSVEHGGDSVGKQLSSLSKDTIRAMWEDFFKSAAKTEIPRQLLHTKKESHSLKRESVLEEGKEFSLLPKKEEKSQEVAAAHAEYFNREVKSVEIQGEKKQEKENFDQVEMIKSEIRKLIKAQKEMEVAFKNVAQQVISSPTSKEVGTYDVNFFEWVLLTIRNARMRVEEGRNWLTLFASKKGQQKYWAQADKKGTSFTQHHDRSVATQTG
jgi:uncharacterized protein YkuJ